MLGGAQRPVDPSGRAPGGEVADGQRARGRCPLAPNSIALMNPMIDEYQVRLPATGCSPSRSWSRVTKNSTTARRRPLATSAAAADRVGDRASSFSDPVRSLTPARPRCRSRPACRRRTSRRVYHGRRCRSTLDDLGVAGWAFSNVAVGGAPGEQVVVAEGQGDQADEQHPAAGCMNGRLAEPAVDRRPTRRRSCG